MPLIEPPAPPPQPTPAEAFKRRIDTKLREQSESLRLWFNGLMMDFWRPAGDLMAVDSLTPPERFEAMGNKAAELFTVAWSLRQVLLAADPTLQLMDVPAEWSVTLNHPEGTVTVEPVETEPE